MINKSAYRLYGRTKGRKKQNTYSFSKIRLKTIDKKKNYIIDIGAGFGESTIKLAKANKDKLVICCEKYIDGLNSLFNKAQSQSLENILIYQGNVHQLLDEHCEEDTISEVWILFPDPWPKKRHLKRRLINKNFLTLLDQISNQQTDIIISTDNADYQNQILYLFYLDKNFIPSTEIFGKKLFNYFGLKETKYYQKAKKSKNKSYFFLFNKRN